MRCELGMLYTADNEMSWRGQNQAHLPACSDSRGFLRPYTTVKEQLPPPIVRRTCLPTPQNSHRRTGPTSARLSTYPPRRCPWITRARPGLNYTDDSQAVRMTSRSPVSVIYRPARCQYAEHITPTSCSPSTRRQAHQRHRTSIAKPCPHSRQQTRDPLSWTVTTQIGHETERPFLHLPPTRLRRS